MGIGKVKKAVFLDRDGVINKLIFNPKTGEYESSHYPEDLQVFVYAAAALQKLQQHGYLLF
jgi:D-glycero-D-manno-heptose 1,7-bisphosphate phosphatase